MRNRTRTKKKPRLLPHPLSWEPFIGKRFGRLTVLGFGGSFTKNSQKRTLCRCDCGCYVHVMLAGLKSGATQSCGCRHADVLAKRNRKNATHGHTRGRKLTTIYRVWFQMKQRCLNPNYHAYKAYGGRGITIYKPWINSFETFHAYIMKELGKKPGRAYSFDRINNERGYVPGNVRWATPEQQNRNRRNTRRYKLFGEHLTLEEWAERVGLPSRVVRRRVTNYNWSLNEALGTPESFGRCPKRARVKWRG